MIRLVIFIVLTLTLTWLSWSSLRQPKVHGFYRFFAFEGLLALVLLNVSYWFTDPLSVRQIISWLLLAGSIPLAAGGFYLLHQVGRPEQGIEQTTALVTSGLYRYIRHPLYASLLPATWGVFLKHPGLIPGLLAGAITTLLWAMAKVEEKENLLRFGEAYAAYIKNSKMFIPFLV